MSEALEHEPIEGELVPYQPNGAAVVALNAALARAQGAFPSIPRSRSVKVQTRTGGEFEYDYAPLEAIMPAIRSTLADNGLAVLQLLEAGPSLRTELRHEEGGIVSASFPFKPPENMQALGSAITYLRRYALVAMLGLVTEHDDDGQSGDSAGASSGGEAPAMISDAQNRKMGAMLKELEEKFPKPEGQLPWVDDVRNLTGVKSRKDMTKQQATKAIDWLQEQLDGEAIPFG